MAEKKEKLFDMFPECSYQEWRAKVEADLKGADFNKKLVEPVYRAENIADLKPQIPYPASSRMFAEHATTTTG